MKQYFISYGDSNYSQSKKRIEQEAKAFGFDEVIIYGPQDLSDEFIRQTSPYINAARGAGLWLWKSYILKKTFELMDEGDILVYTDAGCSVNPHGRVTLNDYIKMLNESDSGMIRLRYMKTPEEMYTTEAVFEYFGKENDSKFRNTDIYMNGIIFFKKNTNSQNYIDRFFEISITRPDLFSDEHNGRHCDKFVDHRHDQSVSSCLVKLYDFIDIEDHTFENDYNGWMGLVHQYKTPFLATRIRS